MIQHGLALLVQPHTAWQRVAQLPSASFNKLALFPVIMALLPAVAWYYGTSRIGWTVGSSEDAIRLTESSAFEISVLFYFVMISSVAIIGYFIHWMSATYGANSSLTKGIVIAGLTCSPLFMTGLVGFYPLLWVDLLIGVVALSWATYLLYLGIPIVMNIPEERGFLFSSAIIAIALVIFVGILVVTVMLWEYGFAPEFTDHTL
ncbi:MAG: hypothetical protein RI942_1930 [Pseudomonadota bacterium]|jgi:hypothetical protein